MKRLNELFAMTGQVGFLASQRVDGKLILPEAVKTLTIRKRDAMITLKEAKNYLRVDYEEDDSLIQNLLSTAKNLVMDVGRMDESAFAENEDTVRTARGRDVMEIGTLNQRITILEHRTVVDEIGNHITKWEETFSLWAKVIVKTASETTDTGVTKEVQKLEFLVRQSPASLNINSTNFRILFRNSVYNVTGITPLYDHNNYMKIEGEIRKAGTSDDYS